LPGNPYPGLSPNTANVDNMSVLTYASILYEPKR
jgi:hypothetical protein